MKVILIHFYHQLLDEPNWEEQRLAIVNLGRLANQRFPWLNPDGPRRRHQIILREEGQDEANPDQADEESSEESENEDNGDNQNFDTQLPTQHSVSHQIILEQCTDKTSTLIFLLSFLFY